ncbi:MAG: sulfatase-like hydrolase/transferase [Porticoccaceae bacterium]|jgi:arylsulfatase A-like enzyme|nr:sulfatase-like hydrolase/transferase [Porticoccaceae bacterium]MBT6319707.1 sulfatase-like hydrolase/transferase [Porticoccaceae bacterium]MBT7258728.1 sulfatase-like hydrolase/transferase [Porticoccaceae bacterium]MBT7905727.1 sulfatase-like hydrolase/transferase [Porticoccaceae bacterium]MDG1705240.1 sulfatase-like hydrolase/transferase [Porticoccaceae bacterium]
MKKLSAIAVLLIIVGFAGWQQRVELLVWVAPKLLEITNPVAENRALSWSQGPEVASQDPADRPPNIVLIVTDDMGFNDISLYNGGAGDGTLQTPSIDALAEQGVSFTNGYAANAVCAPSRASIMTGRYSTRFGFEFTPFYKTGVTIFRWMEELQPSEIPLFLDEANAATMKPIGELGLPPAEITIAELLKQQGYYTAHVGKWHLGSVDGMVATKQGFDDSLELKGVLYLPEDHPDVVNAKVQGDRIDRMVWATGTYSATFNGLGNPGEQFKPKGYLTDYYTDQAVEVIENNRHRPFFLYLAHWGVHNPLQASREDYDALSHIADHRLRVYSAMIRAVDRSVARVTQSLEDNGLADNTLIILTSDNGGAGYIGLPNVNKPYRGWKLNHFEGGTHVPFMAKWPAQINPGTSMDAPIHHNDIYSTIAAAAGVQVPQDRKIDGVDLLPYIRNEVEGEPHQTLFWREGHQQAVLHKGWKLISAEQSNLPQPAPRAKWLFNLALDPTEQNNLAADNLEKVAELETLLAAHNAEQVEPLWPSVFNAPQLIDKTSNEPFEEGDEFIYWPN